MEKNNNNNNNNATATPTWGVWGITDSDTLSSSNVFHHRRGASLPSSFLFPVNEINDDVPSPLLPPVTTTTTTGSRPRLGQRAAALPHQIRTSGFVDGDFNNNSSAASSPLLDLGSPPSTYQHRRVGSNPLIGDEANKFGPSLLPFPPAQQPLHTHRRSVTFDHMDLSSMTSLLDSMPTSPPKRSLTPPAVHHPQPPATTTTIDAETLQAQLAMQQSLMLQHQQWLTTMQQMYYAPPPLPPQQQQHYRPYHHHHHHHHAGPHRTQQQPLPIYAHHHQQQQDLLLLEYKQNGIRPNIDTIIANGSVNSFALDAHGSRFLQHQMEVCTAEEKESLVLSTMDNCIPLMQDTFGNYVMQNFFSHSSPSTRTKLAQCMRGHMLMLAVDPHGCRVVQRMLDLVDIPVRNELLMELISGGRQNVFVAACNTHGTHVLQKTVSMLRRDGEQGKPLLAAMESQISLDVIALLLHPNSYRLVLNVLGDCNRGQRPNVGPALDTILTNQLELAKDQHGNFILQQLLGVPQECKGVLDFCLENLVELSKHKFASHLVEKCLVVASNDMCLQFVEELLRPKSGSKSVILDLMTDPYANFVVQKAFDRLGGDNNQPGQVLKTEIITLVQTNAKMLGTFTCGRYILGHVISQQQQQQQPHQPQARHHNRGRQQQQQSRA